MHLLSLVLLLCLLVLIVTKVESVSAEVRLPGVISDGMVIQRDANIHIWGWADDGEKVTVGLAGRSASAVAKDGKWSVTLKPMKAGGPHTLTITGSNTIEIRDILVGDVWVCSGQSNMELTLSQSFQPEKDIASSANPMIHLFSVPHDQLDTPVDDVSAQWQRCEPTTVRDFSAVGYYFGRDLQKALGVPIGLIDSSVGGTPVEAWTSMACFQSAARMKAVLDDYVARGQAGIWKPCGLYNGMMAPLVAYPIRGAIWYQGESNAGRPEIYKSALSGMIRNWRSDWNIGDFPFLMVQLAPYGAPGLPADAYSLIREVQLQLSLEMPKVGLAVITDVGEENDIHPPKKEPVGARLALAAQHVAYGKKITYSGPLYKSKKQDGNKLVLSFTHVDGGLTMSDGSGELNGFEVAGQDGSFMKAQAAIRDDTVVVWSDAVPAPVDVRYGWANYPVCNLGNKAGLLASPFRTRS